MSLCVLRLPRSPCRSLSLSLSLSLSSLCVRECSVPLEAQGTSVSPRLL